MERIGGHRGLDVFREGPPGGLQSRIYKRALHERGNQGDLHGVDLYGLNETAIHNEAWMLDVMDGSGFTPELLDIEGGESSQQDVGISEPPMDGELWRQNCVRMLATIRQRNLRHGDLKGANIITRADRPWAVDWQEAHYLGDVAPQVKPYSDSHLLMQHVEGTPDVDGRRDIPRVARRWRAVLGSLGAITDLMLPLAGKTFVDLGCFQGDFVALAASEGMRAYGFDAGGFRPGENSIEKGRHIWRHLSFGTCELLQEDIMKMPDLQADVVIMFSTWAYIVRDYGRPAAVRLLGKIVQEADVFFFETQLAGDGPGPEWLEEDDQIPIMFAAIGGKCEAIGRFQVTNRPAFRTVWRVEKG